MSTVNYVFNRVNLFGDIIESVTYSVNPSSARSALKGAALDMFRSVINGGTAQTIKVGKGRYQFRSWVPKASTPAEPVMVLDVVGASMDAKQAGFIIYWCEMIGWRVLSVSVLSNSVELTVSPCT